MANAPTPTTVKKESSGASSTFSSLAIPIIIVIAILVYIFVLGDGSHFKGGDPAADSVDVFGLVHKGGPIVPIILSCLLMTVTFSIERFVVIGRASGTGSVESFVKKVQAFLNSGNIEAASAECDKQKGSVANVIKSGLKKYREMELEPNLDVDQKTLAIQKDIEEATSLEMPMLEQNLTIIATLVSIGTLMGLLGTVFGMIGAFRTMGAAGAPNASELSSHISEALINTFLGISTSAISIIMYNIFTSKIDKLTYAIDETGFSIVQTFAASHKNTTR